MKVKTLRMPEKLEKILEEKAKEECRSFSAEVIKRVLDSLKRGGDGMSKECCFCGISESDADQTYIYSKETGRMLCSDCVLDIIRYKHLGCSASISNIGEVYEGKDITDRAES